MPTPNAYLAESRKELAAAAAELMEGQAIEPAPVVDLLDDAEPLEVELATSLLYPHCHYRYRQLRGQCSCADRGAYRRTDRAGNEAPRTPRRAAARLLRRTGLPLRHPDGHRRLPRHAPPPPLRAAAAGLHRSARLRRAGLPRTAHAGRGRTGSRVQSSDGRRIRGVSRAARLRRT